MGAGYAQVGLLLLLTVVGLPLFFFGLMAALDRFERAISPRQAVPGASTSPATSPEPVAEAAPETAATVVSLPVASPALASAPLAATGGAAAVATGKSAAAI